MQPSDWAERFFSQVAEQIDYWEKMQMLVKLDNVYSLNMSKVFSETIYGERNLT